MAHAWPEIVEFYSGLRRDRPQEPFWEAIAAMKNLACSIAKGPLSSALYGFTSMHDLIIRQAPLMPDFNPFEGPYLRISPTQSGMVEFRYYDTSIEARQWHRAVPPDGVVGRLNAFLDQLHWIAGSQS